MELRIVIYKSPDYNLYEGPSKPYIGAVVTSDEIYNRCGPYSGNADPSDERDAEKFADYGKITKLIKQVVDDYYSAKSAKSSSNVGEGEFDLNEPVFP